MFYSLDIKKCSLGIICYLLSVRSDIKDDVMENGMLELCLKHVELFPEDDIDEEILTLSLDLISKAVSLI
jgi:hypothetical protein